MDADYEDIGENGGNEYGDADLGLVADAKYLEMLMIQIWVFACCKIFGDADDVDLGLV